MSNTEDVELVQNIDKKGNNIGSGNKKVDVSSLIQSAFEKKGLDKKGGNMPANMTEESKAKMLVYDEYRQNFDENQCDSFEFDPVNKSEGIMMKAFGEDLFSEDGEDTLVVENREHIWKLHNDRIISGERNFLEIVEKSHLEKLNTWKPKHCLEKMCWRFVWVWYQIKHGARLIIDHPIFEAFIIQLILTNSITLAMDDPTQPDDEKPEWTKTISLVYLILYTVEMCLKILGLGFIFNRGSYLRDGWNILDFIIVVSGYSEIVFAGSGVSLSALRTLRVLRPQRTVSSVKDLKTIIVTIFNAMPYLTEVLVVVQFVFLVFAIAGLQLFSGLQKRRCFDESSGVGFLYGAGEILCNGTNNCPGGYICGKMRMNPDFGVTSFDNFAEAFLMVFQVTTMEGWTLIMVQIQRVFTDLAILYFILLVFVGNFFLLNLLLAVIIFKFTEAQNEQKQEDEAETSMLQHEINLIFPEYRPQSRKNVFDEGLPLARMKFTRDATALCLSNVETRKEHNRKLEDQMRVIDFFLKHYNKTAEHKDKLFHLSYIKENGKPDNYAIKSNLAPNNKDNNDNHVAFDLKQDVVDIKSQTQDENLVKKINPPKNIELAKVAPSDIENLKKKDSNLNSLSKANGKVSDNNSFQKNESLAGRSFWENMFKPGQKLNKKESSDADVLNYSYDQLKTMEKSKLEELANSNDQQKFLSDESTQRFGPKCKKLAKSKTSKTTNSEKMNQTSQFKEENYDIDSDDDPDTQLKNKSKKIPETNLMKNMSSDKQPLVIETTKKNGERLDSMAEKKDQDAKTKEEIEAKPKLGTVKLHTTNIENQVSKNSFFIRLIGDQKNKKKKKKTVEIAPEVKEFNKKKARIYANKEKYLKLEVDFKQTYNPETHFNSIRDVKPSCMIRQKQIELEKQSKELADKKFTLEYNVDGHLTTSTYTKPQDDDGLKLSDSESSEDSSEGIDDMAFERLHEKAKKIYTNNYLTRRKAVIPIDKSHRTELILAPIREADRLNKLAMLANKENALACFTKKNKKEKPNSVFMENYNDLDTKFKSMYANKNGADSDEEEDTVDNAIEQIDSTYIPVFNQIQKDDIKESRIEKFNYSGTEVCNKYSMTDKKSMRLANSLNDFVSIIWLSGFKGAFKLSVRYMREFVDNFWIENFLMLCVFGNTLVLALDGLVSTQAETHLTLINLIFTAIFIAEMTFKIYGKGLRGYCADYFNVFDGIIVILSIIELVITEISASSSAETTTVTTVATSTTDEDEEEATASSGTSAISAFRAVRIFRTFRVLRVGRLLKSLRFMKVIVDVVGGSQEQFTYISMLQFLMIFIVSLLGMQIWGNTFNFPGQLRVRQNFDTFTDAFLTVFQLLTLENWTDVLYNCMRSEVNNLFSIVVLVIWIFMGNFVFLNLFLAILLDGFGQSDIQTEIIEVDNEIEEIDKIHEEKISEEKIKRKKLKKEYKATQLITSSLFDRADPKAIIGTEVTPKDCDGEQIIIQSSLNANMIAQGQDPEYYQLKDVYVKVDEGEEMTVTELIQEKINKNKKKKPIYDGVFCENSCFCLTKKNKLRQFCGYLATHPWFETIVQTVIVLSSFTLVIETYKTVYWSEHVISAFAAIDYIFNGLFIIEACIKIIHRGLIVCPNSYLRDSWSQLDFFIVSASIIDMSFTGIELTFIRILRLLRTQRPLRFISHNRNMKIVVNALLNSVYAILNVGIVILMVWIMFAIQAISFMRDEMGYCKGIEDYYGINKDYCLTLGHEWGTFPYNFDHIGNAFVTLFVLSSLEGWPNIMAAVFDAGKAEDGPSYNGNIAFGMAYFLVFIIIGSLFQMNLFVGVIFLQFQSEQEEEKREKFKFLDDDQMKWIMMQDLIQNAKPNFDVTNPPDSRYRLFVFNIVTSAKFDAFIILCIILNIVVMGMRFEGQSAEFTNIQRYVNQFFTIVFIIEAVFKIYGQGVQYFYSNWNNFDFAIVCTSLLDIMMDILGSDFIEFLNTGPQIARVLRVLRVSRLFKLMKTKELEGINKVQTTIIFSFPALMNVLALLCLIYFIFAVLGVFMFKDAPYNEMFNNDKVNFNNFQNAYIVLFRCSTGEDWHMFMYHFSESAGFFGKMYFLFYILLASFVMLNMFTLVVAQQFEEFYFNPDNPITSFQDMAEDFRKTWQVFTYRYNGNKIKEKFLVEFFSCLKSPLGYRYVEEDEEEGIFGIGEDHVNVRTIVSKQEIAREIFKMNLTVDQDGTVLFNIVLQAALKNAYGKRYIPEDIEKAPYLLILHAEKTCIADILLNINKDKSKLLKQMTSQKENNSANPFFLQLLVQVTMICWKKLACDYDEKLREHEDQGKNLDPNMFVMNYIVHDEHGNAIEDSHEDVFAQDMGGREMEIIDGKDFADDMNNHINNHEMYRSGAKAEPVNELNNNTKIQVNKINVKSNFKDEHGQNSKPKDKLATITENTEHNAPNKSEGWKIDALPDTNKGPEPNSKPLKSQASIEENSQRDYQKANLGDSKTFSKDNLASNLEDSKGFQLSKLTDNLGDSKGGDINGYSETQTLKKSNEGQNFSKVGQNVLSNMNAPNKQTLIRRKKKIHFQLMKLEFSKNMDQEINGQVSPQIELCQVRIVVAIW